MKKIILIRHGRAEDPAPEITDFERSLTLKGKNISKMMALLLREKESSLGTIITSPAFRALETAYIFGERFDVEPEQIIINSRLYYKMSFHYLNELLSLMDNKTDILTLFGHNPSFSEITDSLCKGGCDFMPKCGVAGISFNVSDWKEVKHNTGKMEYFLKPEKVL